MPDLLPIYRALEWSEARLPDKVSVADMAVAASYSLFHFIRTFNQIVRHTPYDYLMRRRLAEAARGLIESDRRVVDIALEYQFGNHETFSRAFKRLFGLQPTQWRERGFIPPRALLPPLSLAYLEHIHQPGFLQPEVVEIEACELTGLMAPLSGPPAAISETLWRALGQVCQQPSLAEAAHCYGVLTYLAGPPALAFYLAGIATPAEPAQEIPALVRQTIPAGRYARLAHRGPAASLPFSFDYLYHTWLPKAGLAPAGFGEIIDYGPARPWQTNEPEMILLVPLAVTPPARLPPPSLGNL